jgi:hypothetical protein
MPALDGYKVLRLRAKSGPTILHLGLERDDGDVIFEAALEFGLVAVARHDAR